MARKKTLTFEEKKFQVLQEIINCDNWIYRSIGLPEVQQIWIERKNDFEFMLQDLDQQNEIEIL